MPREKTGLRVHFCQNVATYEPVRKGQCARRVKEAYEAGWFIQVWHCGQWRALMQLRFAREKDALRAAYDLSRAGLDSATAIQKAEPLAVLEIATRYLQW